MRRFPLMAIVVACFALAFGLAFTPARSQHPQHLAVVGVCAMPVSSFRSLGAHGTQTVFYDDGPTSADGCTRPRHRTKHLAFAAIALAPHHLFLGRVPQRPVSSNLFALASSAAIRALSALYIRNTAFFSCPRVHPVRPPKPSPKADPCGPFLWGVRCTTRSPTAPPLTRLLFCASPTRNISPPP